MRITNEPWRALDEAFVEVVRIALGYTMVPEKHWKRLLKWVVLVVAIEATGWPLLKGNWPLFFITACFSVVLLSPRARNDGHKQRALCMAIPMMLGFALTPIHVLLVLVTGRFLFLIPCLMTVGLILDVMQHDYVREYRGQ